MITISVENPTNQYQEPECLAWAAKVQKAISTPPQKSFTDILFQRFPFLIRSTAVIQMEIHELIVINQ